jgi:hypothetical protein
VKHKYSEPNEDEGRSEDVCVCIRNGFAARGYAGQHKYFLWSNDTFTGMGSSKEEPNPRIAIEGSSVKWGGNFECEHYYVTEQKEAELKRIAEEKKVVADQKYLNTSPSWTPYINDCHTLVDDTLEEADLPPTKLTRFAGDSTKVYSMEKCTIQ